MFVLGINGPAACVVEAKQDCEMSYKTTWLYFVYINGMGTGTTESFSTKKLGKRPSWLYPQPSSLHSIYEEILVLPCMQHF